MNRENMLKFMTELKEFCEKYKECEKCELDDCCRAFGDATLPFEWKIPDENKRWRAESTGLYWYIDADGSPNCSAEYDMRSDNYHYNSHNYFRTQEEAEKYARVLETEMLLKKFADEHNYKPIDWSDDDNVKFYLIYACTTNRLLIVSTYDRHEGRVIYFNSKEIAQNAINEIGKDRIIEYLTYEW